MRTHAKIIEDSDGVSAFAAKVGADANTAKQWKRLDSIPARYWKPTADAGLASLDELAAAAAARPRKAKGEPSQVAA